MELLERPSEGSRGPVRDLRDFIARCEAAGELIHVDGAEWNEEMGAVVVVDHDVDPSDMFDVLWAMCTCCDPIEDIDFIRKAWSTPLDPMIPHGATVFQNSRAVIDACRPFERLKNFPLVARATPELLERVKAKFGAILDAI